MDVSPTGLAKLLLPRTPLILKTAILNKLSLSPNSSKQDATTEVTVAVLRSILDIKKPLGYIQKVGLKDPGIKGPMWISKVSLTSSGGAAAADALKSAISTLGEANEVFSWPEMVDVEGEWTGHRSGVDKNAPRLDIPEGVQYNRLMLEVKSTITVIYFHGGAHFLMDPSSHRAPTSHLAKLTGGRVFSVRYRLAPQNPFPAALLDAFIAYLSLVSPGPSALHKGVPPNEIIFAGDSAGGNLALSLLQLLLTLQRNGTSSISFNNCDVKIEVPAGLALNSPWCDISRSMPSVRNNAQYDYLEPPSATGIPSEPVPDEIWPTKPPRAEIYCTGSVLLHPLVSPLATTPEQWEGSCPVYMCCGNEGLEDEISILARKLYRAGATVVFDGYEGMPHCFSMMFVGSPASKECFRMTSQFCLDAVEGKVERQDHGRWMKACSKPLAFRELPFETISQVTDSKAGELMAQSKQKALEREQAALKEWENGKSKSHL